ncbi:class I mannose-6-phosphate isomerase [Anseongella ginsenosidimutans]|nr:class I mannose-6-phosphate isomerase [Anseongella ginsenosidimutans]
MKKETASGMTDQAAPGRKDQTAGMRKTTQPALPLQREKREREGYDIFPVFSLEEENIYKGYETLAAWISDFRQVTIDGYSGVHWQAFTEALNQAFRKNGISVNWHCIDAALKGEAEIERLTAPFLGGEDPLFGRLFPGELTDFFETAKLEKITPPGNSLDILYGTGAALAGWKGPLVYLDVPRNEIQYRSRAGSVCNTGRSAPRPPAQQYKQFFFVDWVVLNKHRKSLLPRIDAFVDQQRTDGITWMEGENFRHALDLVVRNAFRARPWFEAGAWGGNWMKQHIEGLPYEEINYAWSFELITPENGVILESSGKMLEFGFDFLMVHNNKAVLGKAVSRFGDQFPIRFDFLDTFSGGNLSLQCHPGNAYIKAHFGENFTQDETYYILDAGENAEVYLGFREGVSGERFRETLEESVLDQVPVQVEDFVQVFPAKKHDLFLIPNRTIHCSGVNNLVLEISSTPYIYTFKLYDWLRPGLDGKPRPLNLQRGFENLDFSMEGERVKKELLSVPQLLEEGDDWQLLELPTHQEHFYRIQRLEFESEMQLETEDGAQVCNLVEGGPVRVYTSSRELTLQFAETFVVPAAAGTFKLVNLGKKKAKVVKAFVK